MIHIMEHSFIHTFLKHNSDIFHPEKHRNCTENKAFLVYKTLPKSMADLSTLDSFSIARNFCTYVRSYITVAI